MQPEIGQIWEAQIELPVGLNAFEAGDKFLLERRMGPVITYGYYWVVNFWGKKFYLYEHVLQDYARLVLDPNVA